MHIECIKIQTIGLKIRKKNILFLLRKKGKLNTKLILDIYTLTMHKKVTK